MRLPRRGHPAAPASNAIHIDACRPKIVSQAPAERPRVPTITVGLRPHPSTPAAAAATGGNPAPEAPPPSPVGMLLTTMYATPDGGAVFEFHLDDSRPAELRIPAPAAPGPADGLWKHTCFEAFVGVEGEPGYREYNFSPSGQWAVYAFGTYRERIEDFQPGAAPAIRCLPREDGLTLEARVPAAALPPVAPGTELQVGLAAVIERAEGGLEYWAVHHARAEPDFHARESFVLMLKTFAPTED